MMKINTKETILMTLIMTTTIIICEITFLLGVPALGCASKEVLNDDGSTIVPSYRTIMVRAGDYAIHVHARNNVRR